MGRRATATTKGGRFMNPADQERKQARKRELKKNKKQRVMVRQAVLKSKDPADLLDQMRRLDAMEFDPDNPPPLAEKVINEKRQKLRETYGRVMGMYKREEEKEKFQEMKKNIYDYDRLRAHLEQNFQAIKFAKEANPAEIPLPDGMCVPNAAMTPAVPKIPLPPGAFPPHMMLPEFSGIQPMQGILKKGTRNKSDGPPGPPCGLPPLLSDSEDESDSDEDDDARETRRERARVRFDAPDAQDEKDSRTKFKELARRIAAGEKVPLPDDHIEPPPENEEAFDERALPPYAFQTRPAHLGGGVIPLIPPGARLLRPPPPPPGGPPPRMATYPIRLPLPPGSLPPGVRVPRLPNAAVISAGPSISRNAGPIIEAKPQLRNMQQEVTKLVPTAVRVRREGTAPFKKSRAMIMHQSGLANQAKNPTKDDAYDQFMNEMQGLL